MGETRQVEDTSLEEAAAFLYGLPLEQFTGARDERARDAREAGDRALAEQVHALRKPSVAAWLANQLVRQHPQEVQPLLALGEALREATAQLRGDELRRLTIQQRHLVAALVEQARAMARDAGQRVSEDAAAGLADTLRAALADPEAATELAAGRLSAALTPPAFGVMLNPAPPAGAPAPSATSDPAAVVEPARAAQAAARAEVGSTEASLRQATRHADLATDRAGRARDRVRQLRDELDAATRAATEAEAAARDAEQRQQAAARDAEAAEAGLRQAQARVAALQQPATPPTKGRTR